MTWFRLMLRALLWTCFGFRSRGRENLPSQGPFILAPNHQSYLDPMLVAVAQGEGVYFMAWHALFRVPVLGPVIRWWAAFPVNTEQEDPRAVRLALLVLKRGGRLVVFPEGERTMDGSLLPMKSGVARLALQTGAPIVPVRISGAHRAWPKGKGLRPIRGLEVEFGPAIHMPANLDKNSATEQIMKELEGFLKSARP